VRSEFQQVRDTMYEELKKTGYPIEPLPSEGGYFVIADISKMR
jgi:aspartate/methionine/tyrosine aminotransferase